MSDTRRYTGLKFGIAASMFLATVPVMSVAQAQNTRLEREWIRPGQSGELPAQTAFANPLGMLGIVNAAGAVQMGDHPFFQPLGTNGRACVSCHQPSDSMGLSLDSIHQQWELTN